MSLMADLHRYSPPGAQVSHMNGIERNPCVIAHEISATRRLKGPLESMYLRACCGVADHTVSAVSVGNGKSTGIALMGIR